jgi:hypothetical protein
MPSSFTSSQQKSTQNTTIPGAGAIERALQDQLYGLGFQQADAINAEMAKQRAFMNPHEALAQLSAPAKTKQEIEAAMRKQFGNNLVDRFNAGGGTGKGLTPEEFQAIRGAQRQFAGSDLRDQGEDLKMQLQQQVAQEQYAQQLQSQALDRLQNPYALSLPEEQAINQIYNNQRMNARYNMDLAAQDNATARGLNLSDSPVANEYVRQLAMLESNLGAAQAGDLMNRGDANRNFGLNALGFANGLMQQNFQNRLGVNQMLPTANAQLMAPLMQNRLAQTSTSGTMTNTPSGFDTMMRGIGAAGGLMMGAGMGLGGLGSMGLGSAGAGATQQALGQGIVMGTQGAMGSPGLSGGGGSLSSPYF